MARLYLDEDSQGQLILDLARQAGLDVTCSADAGMNGASDPEQLAYATREGRVFVTANAKDFAQLNRSWAATGQAHPGIVIRKHGYRAPEVVARLTRLLASVNDSSLRGGIFYLSNH